jgi:chemotaxis regulatin CheY-phosphate phosphatase CheZ
MVFKDIKKISSDAVGLITEFGSPEMTESLDIIKEITVAAQGIMESLENPQLVKNIENMRLSMKSMRDARDRMKNVFEQLAEIGIIDEIKNTTRTIRSKVNSIDSEQNLKELITAIKDTVQSVQGLAAELKTS